MKAWSAACHAGFVGDRLDKTVADYGKMQAEDEKLAAEVKTLENAIDYHTKENRDKRKALQERRTALTKHMQALALAMQQAQLGLTELHQSIEANLQLAKHAETWEWKEVGNSNTVHPND